MSAETELQIVSHYNLTTANPQEWPTELDETDDEIEEQTNIRRSRSRYSALERSASDRRTLLPGSQRTGDGKANLVQKDEPDPLGQPGTVIGALRNRGLPVEHDMRLRNKFLLSSTTFSPALFLSQTHSNDSTDDLLEGLKFLSRSIDQKAQSLKVLVETNFERFVRAKATIDNVYNEMRNQGMENIAPLPAQSTGTGSRHSRIGSRNSGLHTRNFSGGSTTNAAPAAKPSKNALRKETEYGVQGIKGPLLEVSQRAEDVWGPALGGREREASLKAVVEAIEKDRALYSLGGDFSVAIRQKNYERAVDLYRNARTLALQATALAEKTSKSSQALSDDQIHKILVTGRMWADVEEQAKTFRRDIWRRLTSAKSIVPANTTSSGEEHMELIGILLELGVEDNPIWVWLLSRYDNLKNKISAVVDRSKVEIEILRRRLASAESPSPETSASYLRHAAKGVSVSLDSVQVTELWTTLLTYVNKLLSQSNGLLGEIVDFWESAQSFIDGNKQKALPSGYEGESRKHHRLSEAGVRDLQNGVVDLVNLLRDALFSLFAEPPTDDISSLFSPPTGTAATPSTPFNTAFSPSEGRVGNIDSNSLPELSPKKGETWEDFAFWPPYSNSLSAVHYLGKILVLAGAGASEMIALAPVSSSSATYEKIKAMINALRERCLRAVCDAWGKDAENCKFLEDWLRSPERKNQTRLPVYFNAFEGKVLTGMHQVVFFSESVNKATTRDMVQEPSPKLQQMVRTQFVSSIYKALSGMYENAESQPKTDQDDWIIAAATMQKTALDGSVEAASYHIDAKSRNVRMLLTLSNLKSLRNEEVPALIQQFETYFSVKLTDESKTIKDVFGQVDAKLFHSYTKPTVAQLTKTIKEGINSPSWAPSTGRPNQVSPYVYAALMILVMVHTEVSTTVTNAGTSNATLLNEILSYLFECVSQALLDGFKERKPNTYPLSALIQATLDTEFIAQTMSHYVNKKVSNIQNSIYHELDIRTTNDARAALGDELGEMKGVLKKLREGSRNSFSCFKRQRGSTVDKDKPKSERTDSNS